MTSSHVNQSLAPRTTGATGFVLCADDYGIAPGVGRAIRELLELGRLSATSCMTGSVYWPEEAKALRPYAERADIGLHLTLTDQVPCAPMPNLAPTGKLPSITRMILMSYAGRLSRPDIRSEISTEIRQQLDRFEAEMGRPPAYLDGHQHVHQLPVIRELVIEIYQERLRGNDAYVRFCSEPLGAILRRRVSAFEALVISLLGRGFARMAVAAGIPGNRHFAGVHDFSGRVPFGQLFEAFLKDLAPGTLIMCHPGIADAALADADSVTTAREDEYRYFRSEAFLKILRNHNAFVSRFSQSSTSIS